jgi:prepilin-type N-terminal cleavage/methylation domain-containing protein
VDSGQWAAGGGRREIASGYIHHSSFIIHHFRRGVTLVEMLIVISIMAILTVAALKLMQPVEDRRVREAARAVNVYISSARNRAMEIGRPCGVIFRRANGTNFPTASMVLDQCEVPPPYAGDETNSLVKVQDWTFRPDGLKYFKDGRIVLKVQIKDGQFSSNLLRPGDLMQLNGQGPFYTLIYDDPTTNPSDSLRTQPPYTTMNPPSDPKVEDFKIDSNGYYDFNPSKLKDDPSGSGWVISHWLTIILDPKVTPVQMLPWPQFIQPPIGQQWSPPVSFLILRQPVKSSASSLQLPAGSMVDLDFSGTDYQSFQNPTGNYYDVAVIFSSNGSVEGYYWNNQPFPALGPIFMLIGSRSRVRDFVAQPLLAVPNLNDLPNWADLSSIWVTINYQTGMVSTDDNYAINFSTQQDLGGHIIDWTQVSTWPFFLNLSRNYARESQSMGGR